MEPRQNSADSAQAALDALCAQLGIVDESIRRIAVILVGVALSLRATLVERGTLVRLICGDTTTAAPSVAPMRITASLLILSSLFFFTKLSARTLCESEEGSARCSAQIDHKGNLLVLAVALARLWDLFRKLPETSPEATIDTEPTIA